MPSQVLIQSSSAHHVLTLASVDLDILSTRAEDPFLNPIWRADATVFSVERASWLKSARSFHEVIVQEWDLLPYRYSFLARFPGLNLEPSWCSTAVSGFHIHGYPCFLSAGIAQCAVRRMEVGANGKGRFIDSIDYRGTKQIQTEDWGVIRISRRKLKSGLLDELDALIRFLDGTSDPDVAISEVQRPTAIMELIRRAADGDESAEEELFNRGDVAKQELTGRLENRRARKYHATICWLLLTLFPSPESRAAVERLIDGESDPGKKSSFLGLLAAAGGSRKS